MSAITAAETSAHFTVYAVASPNPVKVLIALEELGFTKDKDYNVVYIKFRENQQKQPWFTALNPNGKVPVLTDHRNGDFHVFESGAILQYLTKKYDPEHKLYPAPSEDLKKESEVDQWLMFQMAGIGPMLGQHEHFYNYAPVQVEYAKQRYNNEARRLLEVVDKHLEGKEWLAAGQYSIADIATIGWLRLAKEWGYPVDGLENLAKWIERVASRPAVQRGVANLPRPQA
ncbi:glutathione S-transferase [Ramicandelaber brevisporus]|nr:glutathione S-transferase [Ramicandelaber brevisporus]